MPQSILGLAALMLAAILSISQQRAVIESYDVRIRDEYAVAGSGLVMYVMEMAAARSFDEQSTPEKVQARMALPGTADLTASSSFGTGPCDLMTPLNTPACDDLDDLDGIRDQRVTLTLPSGATMAFSVDVDVSYVKNGSAVQPVSHRTNHKRVTVTAHPADVPLAGQGVHLERVISFDPVKALAEHEAVYGPLSIET